MKEEKIICYHHDDMDGMASAAIVKEVYPQAKLVKVNYGDTKKPIYKGFDTIFVVDFSFSKFIMEEMIKNSKIFCWIDHHKSAKEKLPELWDSDKIDGLRSLEKSGCELTWEWFNPHEECPMIIQHIGDRDLWKFKLDGTKELHEILSLKINKPEDLIKLLGNHDFTPEFIVQGKILLEKKMKQVTQSFNEGMECIVWVNPDKTAYQKNCLICNTNNNVSELGNYICKQGYDIGIVWSVRNNKNIVSLRSIGNIDVSIIAEAYGGGGHRNAAGFSINSMELFDKVFDVK